MPAVCSNRRRGRRPRQDGVGLLLAIMSLVLIIPMVGLAIDVAIVYSVKTRLQSSVDGAALAAARSLTLGATAAAQATSARQNAVSWFYANFPTGNWATTNTTLDQSGVSVADDPSNNRVRKVGVTAATDAPTYFMKWFGVDSVRLSATGTAARRDVVVMMVLDRSYSMQRAGACSSLIDAAKIFTGQFAAGRDLIGAVSFSDNVYLHTAPTANFQSVLGYTNSTGSGAGLLDNINCSGYTNMAQAISVAYNELARLNLQGALNVIMFETDGLPNTLTLNFWDGNSAGIANGSSCRDKNGKTKSASGFGGIGTLPNWTSAATIGATSIPGGIVGAVGSGDPADAHSLSLLMYPAPNQITGFVYVPSSSTPGCAFGSNHSATSDLAWFPSTDVYGNQLYPSTDPYKTVQTSGTNPDHVLNNGWTNYHNAARNAADNAAYRARTSASIPIYFFAVGLGGTSQDPPDYTLLQRMANDPHGDDFNSPALYNPCPQQTGCITYSTQPEGTFIFSSDPTKLSRAFLKISSSVLRLSQ